MDYAKFFSERLARLRMKEGVSARDMSISMGQSSGYINKIENRQNLPSMTGFFAICDYLDISPEDFFNQSLTDPYRIRAIENKLMLLSDEKLKAVDIMIDALLDCSDQVAANQKQKDHLI